MTLEELELVKRSVQVVEQVYNGTKMFKPEDIHIARQSLAFLNRDIQLKRMDPRKS